MNNGWMEKQAIWSEVERADTPMPLHKFISQDRVMLNTQQVLSILFELEHEEKISIFKRDGVDHIKLEEKIDDEIDKVE